MRPLYDFNLLLKDSTITGMMKMLTKKLADSIETIPLALRDYNASLEEDAVPSNLSENFIESKLCELEQMEFHCSEIAEVYWLIYARLFELALLCAGNYADHFEFAAAGDLLVNPRLIVIHLKSGCKAVEPHAQEPVTARVRRNLPKLPSSFAKDSENNHIPPQSEDRDFLRRQVKKDRHRKLPDQFRYVAGKREGVVAWLKQETVPEIVEKPLLPHMEERMTQSGFLSRDYLELVERRMKRIADAIGFLAAWHFADSSAFYLRVQCASPSEQTFIESNLCRFDKEIFFELGDDLRRLAEDPCQNSRFIRLRQACPP